MCVHASPRLVVLTIAGDSIALSLFRDISKESNRDSTYLMAKVTSVQTTL